MKTLMKGLTALAVSACTFAVHYRLLQQVRLI